MASTTASHTYTPHVSRVGQRLRFHVHYRDANSPAGTPGLDKTASSGTTSPVEANVPLAPQNLKAKAVGLGYEEIELTWDAPSSNGGSSITGYEYQWQKAGTDNWSGFAPAGSGSQSVSGLTGGTGYEFEVRARNKKGPGAVASASGATRASDESEGEGETPPDEGEPPASAKPVLLGRSATPDSVLAAVSVPNPFNPSTTLHVQLPGSGPVSLTLYNLSGQVVRRLMEGRLDAGVYAYEWDGRDGQGQPVGSGVYIYRLRASDQIFVGKVTLIR